MAQLHILYSILAVVKVALPDATAITMQIQILIRVRHNTTICNEKFPKLKKKTRNYWISLLCFFVGNMKPVEVVGMDSYFNRLIVFTQTFCNFKNDF